MRVREVLRQLRREVETIAPSATAADAIKRFLESKVRALVVVSDGVPEGIITVRDVLRHIDVKGGEALQHEVSAFMSSELICVEFEAPLDEVHRRFVDHDINHLIVVDDGRLIGLVTPADVLGRHLDYMQFINEHLSTYISGSPLQSSET